MLIKRRISIGDDIFNKKIVPVVTFNHLQKILQVMDSLREGGLKIAEIKFRAECAKKTLCLATESILIF